VLVKSNVHCRCTMRLQSFTYSPAGLAVLLATIADITSCASLPQRPRAQEPLVEHSPKIVSPSQARKLHGRFLQITGASYHRTSMRLAADTVLLQIYTLTVSTSLALQPTARMHATAGKARLESMAQRSRTAIPLSRS